MNSFNFRGFWRELPGEKLHSLDNLYLVVVGFFVGLCAAAVVAIFRYSAEWAYLTSLGLMGKSHNIAIIAIWLFLAAIAALFVGRLISDPAIRKGGAEWIRESITENRPHAWRKILIPKFVGSWLVKAFGNSVGMEGPSIQMGCATALGLKNFNNKKKIERRFFVVGGSAAGLAAAFSSPFAGICWTYEIMRERMTPALFIFLLGGSFGVFLSCAAVFGSAPMLPLTDARMPSLTELLLLPLLGIFSGACGIAYNYLLRFSSLLYARQTLIPVRYRPLLSFGMAALAILVFPAITGEGFHIYTSIEHGLTPMGYLCVFLVAKLLLTSWCYGSGIPAGMMVPVLCIGGVSGAIFSDWMQALGLLPPDLFSACIVMGMAGAFAAAERAPVTGLVLVAQTTGAYGASMGIILTAAIGSFLARLARVKSV